MYQYCLGAKPSVFIPNQIAFRHVLNFHLK